MKFIKYSYLSLIAVFIFAASTAQAHNSLTEAFPSDQSVINESLKALELTFSDETYLEEIKLVTVTGEVIPLDFEPSISASRHFSVPVHDIGEGEYRVKWQVVGDDTHKISGEFSFNLNKKLE